MHCFSPEATDRRTLSDVKLPDQMIDMFLRALIVEQGRSENTLDAYARDIERFLEWHQDKAHEPTRMELEEYSPLLGIILMLHPT